ncbi:trypsin-like peptidase domain-containing protein [Sorangium sp. So ce385]|uniref:trypsin-like serine peptidase n=1 Tax=Sorangium sp. So ce385 TaxID=3133308 RepID=UPI003F5C6BD3
MTPPAGAVHFLDDFNYIHPEAVELRSLLAKAYSRKQDIPVILERAGLDTSYIDLDQAPIYVWQDALRQASDALLLRPLLELVLADKDRKKYHDRIKELMEPAPVVEAPIVEAPVAGGPGLPSFAGPDPESGDVERILGSTSNLVDMGQLAGAFRVSPAVARLEVHSGGQRFYGTGFLLDAPGEPLLLTNHHVLFDLSAGGRKASRVDAWFAYETGPDGAPRQARVVAGNPATIEGVAEHDWAAVRLASPLPEDYPRLALRPSRPLSENDPVFIIQHPRGLVKHIGLTRNQVQYVDHNVVQYLTDTDGGSSGSPVFNDRWEVAALHHRWVEIPQQNGRPPAYRNQGIRIERVREGLVRAGLLPA